MYIYKFSLISIYEFNLLLNFLVKIITKISRFFHKINVFFVKNILDFFRNNKNSDFFHIKITYKIYRIG